MLRIFTTEETTMLEDLAENGKKAQAIATLMSWDAEGRLASDDDTDVESALRELGIEEWSSTLGYSDFYELDRDEIKEWIKQYLEYEVDWDDDEDVYQAWQSVCRDVNREELDKFARSAFDKFRDEFKKQHEKIQNEEN